MTTCNGTTVIPRAATRAAGREAVESVTSATDMAHRLAGGAWGACRSRYGRDMRIVTAGGHGQIARQFGRLVANAGHDAVGIIRKPEQIPDLQEDGVEPAILDLESTDVDALTEVVRGADVVVFAAGGGADGNAARKE